MVELIVILTIVALVVRIIYIIFNWGETHGYYEKYGIGDIFMSFLIYPFIGGCVVLAFWCVDYGFVGVDHYNTKKYELYGLSNSSGANGRFMLGSGTINDVQYIFYNTKNPNGLIKTQKVEMEKCLFDNESDSTYLEYKMAIGVPRYNFFENSAIIHVDSKDEYIFHLRKEDMNINNYYDVSKY